MCNNIVIFNCGWRNEESMFMGKMSVKEHFHLPTFSPLTFQSYLLLNCLVKKGSFLFGITSQKFCFPFQYEEFRLYVCTDALKRYSQWGRCPSCLSLHGVKAPPLSTCICWCIICSKGGIYSCNCTHHPNWPESPPIPSHCGCFWMQWNYFYHSSLPPHPTRYPSKFVSQNSQNPHSSWRIAQAPGGHLKKT